MNNIFDNAINKADNYTKTAELFLETDLTKDEEMILKKENLFEKLNKVKQEIRKHKEEIKDGLNSEIELDKQFERAISIYSAISKDFKDLRKEELTHKYNEKIKEKDELNKTKKIYNNYIHNEKKNIKIKYQTNIDKKISELEKTYNYDVKNLGNTDKSDLFALVMFGNLKIIMDSLKLAEQIGKTIVKEYIKNQYKETMFKAETLEILYKEMQKLEELSENLNEKGIKADYIEIHTKDIKEQIIKKSEVIDNILDETLQKYISDIEIKALSLNTKEEKTANEDNNTSPHEQ